MLTHKVPVWIREFDPVYTCIPEKDEMRYQVLKDQFAYYEKCKVSWCIWLYKEMGLQAILHQEDYTPFMKLFSSFIKRKDFLGVDEWGSTDKYIGQVMEPIEQLFKKEFSKFDPYPFLFKNHLNRLVRNILISEALVLEYCNLFKGLSEDELIALVRSFHFENYVKRQRLEDILTGREQ